jgi:uncharacterized membrane protein
MSRERLEAFSDGVFAVAITLLVLDIHVPPVGDKGSLAHKLISGELWPHYAAYPVSFLTIGIIWINHHAMIRRLRTVDHSIMILNLILLMSVALLPFTTSLLATYLHASQGEHLAAAVYAGSFLLMSVAFGALNRQILLRRAHMLDVALDEDQRRAIFMRAVAGLLPYLVATAISAITPYATLLICAAVAIFYALPIASGTESPAARG